MKRRKIVFSLIVSCLLVCSLLSVGVSAAGKIDVSSEAVECERGDTVKVVLTVEENPGFAALLINIPEEKGIEVAGYENGAVMYQMTEGKNLLWDSVQNSTATGTLVTVTFRVTDKAQSGEHCISVNVIECYNAGGYPVDVSIDPIVINVLGEPLEETDTESEASTVGETVSEFDDAPETETTVETDQEKDPIEEIEPIDTEEDNAGKNEGPENEDPPIIGGDTEGHEPIIRPGKNEKPETEDGEDKDEADVGCSSIISGAAFVLLSALSGAWLIFKRKD